MEEPSPDKALIQGRAAMTEEMISELGDGLSANNLALGRVGW